jgi:PAS domain S-box-containing protein
MKLNGKPALFTAWRDITKRKLAEEALRESEDRYRQLVEMSPDAIAIHQQGKIVYINTAGAIHIGAQTPQEMIGKSILNLVHPDYRAAVIQRVEKTVSGESAPYTVEKFIKLDGTIFDVEVAAIPSVYQGKPATQVIIRDITKRKQAEEALRNSEQRYRLLIETASEGIVVAQNGFIKFVNPMMQVITDFTQEELLTLPFIDYVYPDDREIVINNHLKRLKGEPFLPRYQFRIVKKDGSARSIEMNGIVIEWEGQPATLNLLTDITERIQAEEEIRLKSEQLIKLNAEKDKFFSIIAHDLRSPFNGFLGLTEIMVKELNSLTMNEIKVISVSMRNSAIGLFRLLEDLLQWSRMQQGSIPFNPELLQLLQVVEECITMTIEQAKHKRIDINYYISDDLKIFADSNMLQTIIRNFVSNAVKFTPKGGEIYVSATSTEDSGVEISIKDTGIGMTGEMINNLFRLDAKTNRKGTDGEPSSGLGLLLCKEFVEKHGGRIWVESEVGKGTIFYFILPNM